MLRVTILCKLSYSSVLIVRFTGDSNLPKFNRSSHSDCFECSIGSKDEEAIKMRFSFDSPLLQPISGGWESGASDVVFAGRRWQCWGIFTVPFARSYRTPLHVHLEQEKSLSTRTELLQTHVNCKYSETRWPKIASLVHNKKS